MLKAKMALSVTTHLYIAVERDRSMKWRQKGVIF